MTYAFFFFFFGFALEVVAEAFMALAVGAPLVPGLRIVSPLPALMRFLFLWMFAQSPFVISNSPSSCV